MHSKKHTLFKIISTLLLALCAVSSWYYLEPTSPADHIPPVPEVVAPNANDILPNTSPRNYAYVNPERFGDQKIVIGMIIIIGGLVCAIVLRVIYLYVNNGRDIIDSSPAARVPTQQSGTPNVTLNSNPVPPKQHNNINASDNKQSAKQASIVIKPPKNMNAGNAVLGPSNHQSRNARHDTHNPPHQANKEDKQNSFTNENADVFGPISKGAHKPRRNTGNDMHKPSNEANNRDKQDKFTNENAEISGKISKHPRKRNRNIVNSTKNHSNQPNRNDIGSKRAGGSAINEVNVLDSENKPQNRQKQAIEIVDLDNRALLVDGKDKQKGNASISTIEQYAHLEKVLSEMLSGQSVKNGELTDGDVATFKHLISDPKDIAPDVQNRWNKFIERQKITIDMKHMHTCYQAFIPLLFSADRGRKNLLLFDKIANIFPNVTEIICEATDYDGAKSAYSSDIVGVNFIEGLYDVLGSITKPAKLTKVTIQTYQQQITDAAAAALSAKKIEHNKRYKERSWYIAKGNYILLGVPYMRCIEQVKSMAKGKSLQNDEVTDLDVAILNKLIAADNDLPADVQKTWNAFTKKQQKITIDMGYMDRNYRLFIPLLFSADNNGNDLLSLANVAKIFPNLTEIDYTGDEDTIGHLISNAPQLYTLNWYIVQNNDKNLLLKNGLDRYVNKKLIPSLKLMIQADDVGWRNKISNNDKRVLENLITVSTDLKSDFARKIPPQLKEIWTNFTNKQTHITINIEYMYKYYQAFIPLLFSLYPACANLLLADKIAQLFPHVTQIICEATDYDSNKSAYSADIVNVKFIEGLCNILGKVPIHTKLTKITIRTAQNTIAYASDADISPQKLAKDDKFTYKKDSEADKDNTLAKTNSNKEATVFPIEAYMQELQKLGWVLIKEKFSLVAKRPYLHCITQIETILEAGSLKNDPVTPLDVFVFKQLMADAKDIPAAAKQRWDAFKKRKNSIKINMQSMYGQYARFRPALFSGDHQCSNLLQFDKIATLFPKVTKIVCEHIDCIGWVKDKDKKILKYSPDIINTKFILGLKDQLLAIKDNKDILLKEIEIKNSKNNNIEGKFDLSFQAFLAMGWYIGKGNSRIILMKDLDSYADLHFIDRFYPMICGSRTGAHMVTSLDVYIFNQLSVKNKNNILADTQKEWDEVRDIQDKITINVADMYAYYAVFIPELFQLGINQPQNLLQFDKIATLFPEVTKIVCEDIDCIGWGKDKDKKVLKYSPDIITLQFILALKDMVSTIQQNNSSKLKQITLKTWENEITLKPQNAGKQFNSLGWSIQKEKQKNLTSNADKKPLSGKYNTLTLTKSTA